MRTVTGDGAEARQKRETAGLEAFSDERVC
jgi:hypothetical protein